MKKTKTNAKMNKRGQVHILEVGGADFTAAFATPEFQTMITEVHACPEELRPELDPQALKEDLEAICDQINAGDMSTPERMAMSQAHTLNALFHRLSQRALNNFGGPWFEPYMRMGLRAQAQSARTLETLAALKNPTVFAKQVNLASQQVVNNAGELPAKTAAAPAELCEPAPIVPFAKTNISAPAHERLDR
ncbi:MAG: hypothetical protein ACREIF_02140 [Chthoniobacterales bacterium]